ncbi:MAG: endonuclease domain-containing protein [Micromonosporaceae bacterium]
MAPQDALARGRPPQTTAARSIVDAAQWAATDQQARAIVAAGLQQRLTAADELDDVLARMPRAHRRALITEAVADAAGGSNSLPERALIQLCRRYRLPLPDQQVPRRDATGRRRWLDAYWEEWKLHVEIDGGHHMDVRTWWSDMQRQNSLWVAGDRVLRFPSWAIRHRPHEVAAQLRSALLAAGWPGNEVDLGS